MIAYSAPTDTAQTTPGTPFLLTCPQCGVVFVRVLPRPFDPGLSSVLDCLAVVLASLQALKAAVEEVAL